jgi:hypothetical protein
MGVGAGGSSGPNGGSSYDDRALPAMTSLLAADIYKPDQWRDFFLMVGGGAAALTGLVLVAMSLNLDVIAQDATHRYRAIGTLAGFPPPSSSARSYSWAARVT